MFFTCITRSPCRKTVGPKRLLRLVRGGGIHRRLEGPVQGGGARCPASGWGRAPGSAPAGCPCSGAAAGRHRSTMVSTAVPGSRRRRKKKSPLGVVGEGGAAAPRFTAVGAPDDGAARWPGGRSPSAAPWAAAPERIRSDNRLPGPTEGSWSGSPTSTRRQLPGQGRAAGPCIRGTSTMEVSSTITASASRGSCSLWAKARPPVWLVVPGLQQAVDGGGLRPAQLSQPLGRPARWGRPGRCRSPRCVKQGQDPPQGGGLAGARPPGEEHHLLPGGRFSPPPRWRGA